MKTHNNQLKRYLHKAITTMRTILVALLISVMVLSCGGRRTDKTYTTQVNSGTKRGDSRYTNTNNTDEQSSRNQTQHKSLITDPIHVDSTVTNVRPTAYENGFTGGMLTLGDYSTDPKTFNIIVATEEVSLDIIRRFQISLMEYNEDTGEWFVFPGDHTKGKTGKGYSIETTESGQQIMTIYLRDDVLWTDGVLMKSDDWVWFWNNIYTDKYISPGGYEQSKVLMENGDERVIRAERISDFEFRFIFPRPVGESELFVDFSPMPKHILEPIYEKGTQEDLFTLWSVDTPLFKIVGNGPWVLSEYQRNEYLVFEANRQFFLKDDVGTPLPYLNRLKILSVLDQNTLYLKFMGGEVDSYLIQNADFKQIVENAEQSEYTVLNGGVSSGSEFIILNQNRKAKRMKDNPVIEWFSKKEFRKALSLLIDRETIVKQIHQGLAQPDSAYLDTASPYFDAGTQFDNSYDPERALKLLESIGIRDRNGDGILEDEDENKIRFELNTNSGNLEREKTINTIVSGWKTFGVRAFPSSIEFNLLVTRLTSSYDWDAVLISLESGLFPFNDNFYLSSGNIHVWNPRKEEPVTDWESDIDDLYRAAKYESDIELRKELINEMFSILYDQSPMIPLVKKNLFRVIKNDYGNVNWDRWSELGGRNSMRIFKR